MENKDPDFQAPHSKKPKKDTSVATKERFGSPLKDGEMKTVVKGHVLGNTQKNTLWVLNCFCEWMIVRNERARRDGNEDSCPEDLLDNPDTQNLNKWIPRFVTEVRNKKGAAEVYAREKSSTKVILLFVTLIALVTQCTETCTQRG